MSYAASLDIPWGISESAYGARDLEFTYQYSNFGVPGLGLKRGLSENLVIAPYATGLAAMVDPTAAMRNYARLEDVGALGSYGFYEALDYTRTRLPEGIDVVIVKAFMAHHQGMTIVAAANVLFDGRMRARFHSDTMVKAAELLLHERTPRDVSIARPRAEEAQSSACSNDPQLPTLRRLHTPHSATPQTHILSNGRYAVMLSAAGSGYSRCGDIGITRLQEDVTRDDSGSYIFVRNATTGAVWSAGFQPCGVEPDSYEVTFSEDRAEFVRVDASVTTTLDVVVSPEDNAEVDGSRSPIPVAARSSSTFTSIASSHSPPPAADAAHPAFSNLFVRTEFVANLGVLLATRRRRVTTEPEVWAAHHLAVEGTTWGRRRIRDPIERAFGARPRSSRTGGCHGWSALSNTVGTVLDPIFALRQRVRIPPGATARLSFWTCISTTRASVLDLFDKHRDATAFSRAATLAWTQAQVQLHHLGITAEAAHLFQCVASHVLLRPTPHCGPPRRRYNAAVARGRRFGCTEFRAMCRSCCYESTIIEMMRGSRERRYTHMNTGGWKQLAVDLVILNAEFVRPPVFSDLQDSLRGMVRHAPVANRSCTSIAAGSVFVLRTDLVSAETRDDALALRERYVVAGALSARSRIEFQRRTVPRRCSVSTAAGRERRTTRAPNSPPPPLELSMAWAASFDDGREYQINLEAGQTTPAPWINRDCQLGTSASRSRRRRRLHLGGEQPWKTSSRNGATIP